MHPPYPPQTWSSCCSSWADLPPGEVLHLMPPGRPLRALSRVLLPLRGRLDIRPAASLHHCVSNLFSLPAASTSCTAATRRSMTTFQRSVRCSGLRIDGLQLGWRRASSERSCCSSWPQGSPAWPPPVLCLPPHRLRRTVPASTTRGCLPDAQGKQS